MQTSSAECPLVVDTSTPSCGNSVDLGAGFAQLSPKISLNEKFTIENGEDWMEPLLELRTELKETQDPEKRRQVT